MQYHELKTWPEFFCEVVTGAKTFEVRKNDRDFQVGDTVCLREYDPKSGIYFGPEIMVEITYVTDFMQPQGYVVFAFKKIKSRVRKMTS